mgnify:CR=1 FL=1
MLPSPDAGDHDALRAVLHRGVDQVRAHVRVRVDHVDARQLVELVDRELGSVAELAVHRLEPLDLARVHHAGRSAVEALERLHARRIGLHDVARVVDLRR